LRPQWSALRLACRSSKADRFPRIFRGPTWLLTQTRFLLLRAISTATVFRIW
jgi:hypothetical protein